MDSQLRLQHAPTLTITPQLQQAIRLLQLSYQELDAFLQSHLDENPFLTTTSEQTDNETEGLAYEDTPLFSMTGDTGGSPSLRPTDPNDLPEPLIPAAPLTLREHLIQQVGSQMNGQRERLIGTYLVQFVQPTGYFEGDLEDIAHQLGVSVTACEEVLQHMQRFDPSGICARTLSECLEVQLEDRGLVTPASKVLLQHLELVAQGDIGALSRKCHTSPESILEMLQHIRSLSPKPGLIFQSEAPSLVVPEVLMHWDSAEDAWKVLLNPETTPKILLNKSYYSHVRHQLTEKPEKQYIASQMARANWLIKALHQRSVTLLRVTTEIVRQQQDFFATGIHALKPLILKDVAQTLDLHESTVSRVTSNKYLASPRGTFELKYFFSSALEHTKGSAISSASVRHRIQALIEKEPKLKPLSDDAIAAALQREGIDIARRTVAKYREILNISPAFQRKRWQKLGVR